MRLIKLFYIFLIFVSFDVKANEVKNWLNKEIDTIISAYQNNNLSNENKFLMIEDTINNNFAGTGIAKFVAGKSWNGASKEVKLEYIKLFKRHLALNISSMMQGYSNQNYELKNANYDEKNKVTLIIII